MTRNSFKPPFLLSVADDAANDRRLHTRGRPSSVGAFKLAGSVFCPDAQPPREPNAQPGQDKQNRNELTYQLFQWCAVQCDGVRVRVLV